LAPQGYDTSEWSRINQKYLVSVGTICELCCFYFLVNPCFLIQLAHLFLFPIFFQAILAPFALNMARQLDTPEAIECGTRLVTIAVLSILLTAPIGAIGIKLFGPRLLPRAK